MLWPNDPYLDQMTSSISWLDTDDVERQRMREVVALFREEGAIDEIGMGRIRDSLADLMFPGTSVLWTRARYLLFVPWIFQLLEAGQPRGSAGMEPEERTRRIQMQLARALVEWAEGESELDARGIMGRTKLDVRQTPDQNIWAGLYSWGIRTRALTLSQARREAVEVAGGRGDLVAEDVAADGVWHPLLPAMPEGFPAGTGLQLERGEAEFLAGLLLEGEPEIDERFRRRNESLLPVLLCLGPEEFDAASDPWVLADLIEVDRLKTLILKAFAFAEAIRGAQLLYVRLVAESRGDEQAERVLAELEPVWTKWLENIEVRGAALSSWGDDLPGFWAMLSSTNRRINGPDRAFVEGWTSLVLADHGGLPGNPKARRLIVERENLVKVGKARLRTSGEIGRDAPREIPRSLTFRWDVVRSVISDIREGLER